MARRNESIMDILVLYPWWVSVIAGFAYCCLQFYFTSLETESILLKAFGQIGPKVAQFAAIFFSHSCCYFIL